MKKCSSKNLLKSIKQLTGFNDDIIASWLRISPRTFHAYEEQGIKNKKVKAHAVKLLALLKQGKELFGSRFDEWLDKENFYFDNKKPAESLVTIKGIEFIEMQLTGLEFGANA